MVERIRPATISDAHAIASVHVAGWQVGYRGLIEQAYLDHLDVRERARRWADNLRGPAAVLVHEAGGHVDGFVTFGPSRDEDVLGSVGEVYGLYVHPGSWGRGTGGSLLASAVAQLLSQATTGGPGAARTTEGAVSRTPGTTGPVVLWALEGNRRARRFYEHQGWVADGSTRHNRRSGAGNVPDITFAEVRYLLWP